MQTVTYVSLYSTDRKLIKVWVATVVLLACLKGAHMVYIGWTMFGTFPAHESQEQGTHIM